MNGRVLANAGVFGLGIILIIGGGWAISRGSSYVQLEWGWTSVIAGSIAATGGVLTLAIGCVLQRLDAVHRTLLRAGMPASPAEALAEAEPAKEPMPLGIETAASLSREPERAAFADPALQAAAAVNLELLTHEERPAAPGPAETVETARRAVTETAASEPPPEVIHAADQGPADDMVKAAGASDEPELDAAIEELLAEERAKSPQSAPAVELASEISAELPTQVRPAAAVEPIEPEKAPPRAGGWRGLFSRKEQRATPPPPAEEQQASEAEGDREEQPAGHTKGPEHVPGQLPADVIPRTGDDWFDRALSGLDEAGEPYEGPGPSPVHEPAPREGDLARSGAEGPRGPAEQEPSSSPPPAEPAVIGRYTSGNTTYIMFADGSIEAETPNGVLHFASLAELKVYVEGQ